LYATVASTPTKTNELAFFLFALTWLERLQE
jgi:hypothetical protein